MAAILACGVAPFGTHQVPETFWWELDRYFGLIIANTGQASIVQVPHYNVKSSRTRPHHMIFNILPLNKFVGIAVKISPAGLTQLQLANNK